MSARGAGVLWQGIFLECKWLQSGLRGRSGEEGESERGSGGWREHSLGQELLENKGVSSLDLAPCKAGRREQGNWWKGLRAGKTGKKREQGRLF